MPPKLVLMTPLGATALKLRGDTSIEDDSQF